MLKQHTTQTYLNEQSFIFAYLHLKDIYIYIYIYILKKLSIFANQLMEKPGIHLLNLVFL